MSHNQKGKRREDNAASLLPQITSATTTFFLFSIGLGDWCLLTNRAAIHPVSMFIGVVFFAGEANVMYKMLPAPKKTKKLVHLLLHLAALSLGILGIYAVFKFHNEIGVAHVYSLHSWMGITTFCLFGLQWLLGFLSFWYPGLSTPRREQAVPWHALMGITIFLLTICTAETGLAEKFIFQRLVRESEAYLVNFLGLIWYFSLVLR